MIATIEDEVCHDCYNVIEDVIETCCQPERTSCYIQNHVMGTSKVVFESRCSTFVLVRLQEGLCSNIVAVQPNSDLEADIGYQEYEIKP